jgi:GNAT superfamily N-acetyltransferase
MGSSANHEPLNRAYPPKAVLAPVERTDHAGSIAGSIFLTKSDDPGTAKLRLLYVEPDARGLGIGRRLVRTCIDRARDLGYRKIALWTNDVLVSARHIYEAAGFHLIEETHHHSFGHDLVGQTWSLDLVPPPSAAGASA